MSGTNAADSEFLSLLNSAIEKNISNNQFGVEELADAMNMSRSNLLRKVKKLTGLSVTQLISKVRLEKGMELLKTSSMNVTEVADTVGFGSTSYFIKVFREQYGYSPGKAGEQEQEEPQNIEQQDVEPQKERRKWAPAVIVGVGLLLVVIVAIWAVQPGSAKNTKELSIAVLPFKNESSDSSNVYLINGLMESTLNNLQQIPSLKVVSRTTSERYRNTNKSIPEMARELNVNFFIEGSGQKIGDKILLNIQLIEASSDKHLWAKQYRSEATDIFELQLEIAKNIADEIKVVITPETEQLIARKPTKNTVAYDYYLKGRDLFYRSGRGDLDESRHYFAKAVEYDSTFALAYATSTMVHYYLDIFQAEKKYIKVLDSCAERALRFDPNSTDSYIAKGLSHAAKKEFNQAVGYLEKAHELDPNSGLVIHFLTEFYSIHVFNVAKYLEYSLIGVKIDRASPVDSATTSFKYFHLGNAFASAGFIDEGLMYTEKALEYNPNQMFAKYLKYYVVFAKDRNVKQARENMARALAKDSMRLDITQELAKLYVMERDYENAYKTYLKMTRLRKLYGVNVYDGEAIRMAVACRETGRKQEAEEHVKRFEEYMKTDETIYKHMNLAIYNVYNGNKDEAIKEFRVFLDGDSNYHYWVLLLDQEPYVDSIRGMPEYKELYKRLEKDFWENNREIRKLMVKKGLL